jgi:hypothetical protein
MYAVIYPDGGRSYWSDRGDAEIARDEYIREFECDPDQIVIEEAL